MKNILWIVFSIVMLTVSLLLAFGPGCGTLPCGCPWGTVCVPIEGGRYRCDPVPNDKPIVPNDHPSDKINERVANAD